MFKKQLLPMQLQYFAENTDGTEPAETETTEFDANTLTDEQLAAVKEKFGLKDDNDVDSIIKSKKSRWQKEAEEQRNEAARLAKLSEEERQKALIQKEKDELEKERAEFRKQQLLVEKGRQLQAVGISSEFAKSIGGETAEEAMLHVKQFKEEWDKALKEAVSKELRGSVDKPLSTGQPQPKIDLSKISYAELLKLKQTNPDAYEKASKY